MNSDVLKEARKLIESAHYPNVTGTAIGFKYTRGRRTKRVAVIVYVDKKLPEEQLPSKYIIPKVIEVRGSRVETDVIEARFKALALVSRDRPVRPGYSISHPDVTAGTLGFFIRKGNDTYLVSNAHVIANTNKGKPGDPTYYPGVYDGGTEDDTIGYLDITVPIEMTESKCPIANLVVNTCNKLARVLGSKVVIPKPIRKVTNKVDCAASVVIEDVQVTEEIFKIGRPKGTTEAKLGMEVQKSGRTTEYTKGTIVALDAAVEILYDEGTAVFEGQIVSDIQSAGGDSGSAVLTMGNELVGLLFAGSENTTLINPISWVLDALQLKEGELTCPL